MKRVFKIFLILAVLLASANTQRIIKEVTTSFNQTGIYSLQRKIEFYRSENSFRISPESFLLNDDQLQKNDFSAVWLRSWLALKEQNEELKWEMNLSTVLTLPLYLKYQEGKNLRIIYWVLTQLKDIFAVYLGYRHIKKYGLFHQP